MAFSLGLPPAALITKIDLLLLIYVLLDGFFFNLFSISVHLICSTSL